jgi:membrane protein
MSRSPANRIAGSVPDVRAGRADLRGIVRDVIDGVAKDDVMGLASELTHHLALTVFPFLLMVTALPSVAGALFDIPDPSDRLSEEMATLVSSDNGELVKNLIREMTQTSGWYAFLFGLIGSLWAGISTTSTLRKALNRIYRFDDEAPFWTRKLEEFWLTVVVASLFLAAIVSVLVGPALLGSVPHVSTPAANVLALALVLIAVSLVYWQAPSQPHDFEFATPGALFFAIAWLLFSLAFAGYLSQVGALNHVYGSLGAIIALLFWLYGTSLALLVGAELNAAVAKRLDPQTQANTVAPGEKRDVNLT